MQPRLNWMNIAPEAYQAMRGLEGYARTSGLETALLELVRVRASQINGCAFCLDMHTKDALAEGETDQRLFLLDAWQDAPFYSPRERAALAYTEAVTRIADSGVSDAVYDALHEVFSDKEIVALTMAIVAINAWNRLQISTRAVPGHYQPHR